MAVKKELKTVFTFPNTTFALEAERLCRKENLPGRLIPVPARISAGCGMAWCTSPDAAQAIENLFIMEKITVEGVYEIEL